MENASKSLLEIPLFSRSFPFMSRPDLGTWPFFDSWNSSVLSSQGTVNSTIITYFGYTDHRNISGRRFERVTSLRKCYMCVPRSTLFCKFLDSFNRLVFAEVFFVSLPLSQSWWTSAKPCLLIFLSLQHTIMEPSVLFCDRATRITLYDIVFVQQAGGFICKLPLCQICRKEQQVLHRWGKKTQLKWLIFPQHLSE